MPVPAAKAAKVPKASKRKKTTQEDKAGEDEDEEDEPPACTLYQKVDIDCLMSINELELMPELEKKVQALYGSVFFSYPDEGGQKRPKRDPDLLSTRTKVKYYNGEIDPKGRVTGGHLQGMQASFRRLLCHRVYHDVDMQNSQPCLYAQIVTRAIGAELTPGILTEYAVNRSVVFSNVREQLEFSTTSDKQLKKLFILCLTTAPGTPLRHNGATSHVLSKYKRAVDTTANLLSQLPKFSEELQIASRKKDQTNQMGRFVSCVCCRAERAVLFAMVDHISRAGFQVGVLIHDGLLIERKQPSADEWLPTSVLEAAQRTVKFETGYDIALAEKSLKPTESDLELYNGPKSLQKIRTDFMRCVYVMSRVAKSCKLKRLDDYVYAPHGTIPGVYVQGIAAMDFIDRELTKSAFFASVKTKDLVEWFETKGHPDFELLRGSSFANVIAFRNGCFDLESLQFSQYVQNAKGEWTLESGAAAPMTVQYYDLDFDYENVAEQPTPLWDALISTQLGHRSMCTVCGCPGVVSTKSGYGVYCNRHVPDEHMEDEHCPVTLTAYDAFEILVGRLFYVTGMHDNWQVMLLLKGDSNSGKSTVLNIVEKMFPDGSVGAITSTTEAKFGLQSLYNKRLILIPDMPENINGILPREQWQSMVSGDKVSIAVKNKAALADKKWTVPMAGCTNTFPNWSDRSGSVARRLALFPWSERIEVRDAGMQKKIINSELITILVRCVVTYRLACGRFDGCEFWDKIAPTLLKESKEVVVEESSPLANFLKNGNDFYQVVLEPGSNCTREQLSKAYANHCKFVLKLPDKECKLGADNHPIVAMGCSVKKMMKCKYPLCGAVPGSKDVCGDHFQGGKNRSSVVCIENMRIITKSAQEKAPGA